MPAFFCLFVLANVQAKESVKHTFSILGPVLGFLFFFFLSSSFFFFFFFFLVFLGVHSQHMEVPRPGVELQL